MSQSIYVVLQQEHGSPVPEIQVMATVSTFERIRQELSAFVQSSALSWKVQAAGPCPTSPDAPYLDAILFMKKAGPLLVVQADGRTLEISGTSLALERYARSFHFGQDGGHHHPEQGFKEEDIDRRSEMTVLEAIPDDE